MKALRMLALVVVAGLVLTQWMRSEDSSRGSLNARFSTASTQAYLNGQPCGTLPARLVVQKGEPCQLTIALDGFDTRTYDLGIPGTSGEVVVSLMSDAIPVLHAPQSGSWVACNPKTLHACLQGDL